MIASGSGNQLNEGFKTPSLYNNFENSSFFSRSNFCGVSPWTANSPVDALIRLQKIKNLVARNCFDKSFFYESQQKIIKSFFTWFYGIPLILTTSVVLGCLGIPVPGSEFPWKSRNRDKNLQDSPGTDKRRKISNSVLQLKFYII